MTSVAVVAAVSVSGCVTTGTGALSNSAGSQNSCQYDSTLYIAGGAVVGFAIAKLLGVDGKTGLLASAAVGGALGKGAQAYLTQRCEQIAAAQKRMKSSTVATRPIAVANSPSAATQSQANAEETGVVLTVSSNSMFQIGGARLSPAAEDDMRELAYIFKGTDRKVLIVGHTDSTGSAEANQTLSERRAQAVAKIFEDAGVPRSSLYFKGAGDTRPMADNDTAAGRASNRRVEVVELESEQGVVAFDSKVDSDPVVLKNATPTRTDVDVAQASPPSAAKTLRNDTSLNFGGGPVDGTGASLMASVGEVKKEEGFLSSLSIVSKAFADNEPDPLLNTACIADAYRSITPIKSYDTGDAVSGSYKKLDYMPGLYSTSWTDTVNGHLVGLTKVSVLQDGGRDGKQPEIHVYENYKQGDNKASLHAKGEVRSYIGENGVLYRTFFGKDAWPVRCMDVVFSRKGARTAKTGTLYYDKGGKVYAADYTPKILKK